MENNFKYFSRDVSWLSFNYRVLLEAEDENLPIYERIKFLSIHASNLEEFYKIRVSEHRSVIMKKIHSEEDPAEAEQTLEEVKEEVTRQQEQFSSIFESEVLPELNKKGVFLYMNPKVEDFHREFIRNYFVEEVFPFLQPVLLLKDQIKIFIRDNRLYQVVELLREDLFPQKYYAIIKIPYSKIPRFIELPKYEGKHYFMFAEDLIAANLQYIFPGFRVRGSYNVKISRDADIYIDEEVETNNENLVETIIRKVKKRKIGDLSRFVYDRNMPFDCLEYICNVFSIYPKDLVPDNAHLNMEDLIKLPNPCDGELERKSPEPIRVPQLETNDIFNVIRQQDVFLFYPYHTFDYFTGFLRQASVDPDVEEILLTQYRVAQDSEVINHLIGAAIAGKKVTVFVELKARFDEENNLFTAETMKQAGIRIIYSLSGLKVHAKVALIRARSGLSYAYLSTGNFNEKTARFYSDMAIMTSNKSLTDEIISVFDVLEGTKKEVEFKNILVARFNLLPRLIDMIRREKEHVKNGHKGYILLKMNGLQDRVMINELYEASKAGVEIDLIVRGICCLVPDQPYSKNIRITRIVDHFLEHSRIWYFYNRGEDDLFITSADWMRRNLYRRIETAFPVLDPGIRKTILDILDIQLKDNQKACFIDENLNNVFKWNDSEKPVRAQADTYDYLLKKSQTFAKKIPI
ncbi:MAG: polyphosphate kinase 1 [Dysgonamonadaceae bacterium]|jgi:polyphosphate kinase|nr:polyphosphate kinase 1 [Dysgonamonadaceae bacterium]